MDQGVRGPWAQSQGSVCGCGQASQPHMPSPMPWRAENGLPGGLGLPGGSVLCGCACMCVCGGVVSVCAYVLYIMSVCVAGTCTCGCMVCTCTGTCVVCVLCVYVCRGYMHVVCTRAGGVVSSYTRMGYVCL